MNQNWKIPSAISAISVTLHNKFSFSSKAYHDRVLCEKLCWVLQQCSVDGHLLLSGNPMYFCSDVWTISVLYNETLFSVIFNFALSFLASKVENWCNWRLCSEIKQIRDWESVVQKLGNPAVMHCSLFVCYITMKILICIGVSWYGTFQPDVNRGG